MRDVVLEIESIKGRRISALTGPVGTINKIMLLSMQVDLVPKENRELLKYFPIALVAIMESGIRETIAEIVDSDNTYLGNSQHLLENSKISFNLLKAFQGKRISVGEFVSHMISINKLSDIEKIFSTIFKKDFLKELKKGERHILGAEQDKEMLSISDETFKDISEVFEMRHIFCHESSTKIILDREQIEKYIRSVHIFMSGVVDCVFNAMGLGTSLSKSDINIESGKILREIMGEIDETKNQIIEQFKHSPDRKPLLESSHRKWLEYRQEFSSFSAEAFKGGAMEPTRYTDTSVLLAHDYLKALKKELEMPDSELNELVEFFNRFG